MYQKHQKRVALLSFKLAKELNLNYELCNKIKIAASMHDNGKKYLDKKILYKPNVLNKEEKRYIQRHVYYSVKELFNKGYDNDILEIIFTHHENYSGSGYLLGLKGEDIHIGARIMRICDVFDALTEDRVYKNKLSFFEAIEIMEFEKDKYDPKIFNTFKNMIFKGIEYKKTNY